MLVSRPDLGPTFFNATQEVPVKRGDGHDLRNSIEETPVEEKYHVRN